MISNESLDYEIRFYEDLLRKRPDFAEALTALGEAYTRKGEYAKGLEIDQRLALIKPSDPFVLYNLACSYALTGDVESSFETIRKAIVHGYDDFRHLAEDDDLDALKKDARFRRYFRQILKEKNSTTPF